jgi:hypothetical protein
MNINIIAIASFLHLLFCLFRKRKKSVLLFPPLVLLLLPVAGPTSKRTNLSEWTIPFLLAEENEISLYSALLRALLRR